MADVDSESQEKKAVRKPAAAKQATGGSSPVTMVAVVIALAALGLSVFMFTQLQAVNKKLMAQSGDLPKGIADNNAAGDGGEAHGETPNNPALAWKAEPDEVEFRLGELTANTKDAKYAKLDITLLVESYYSQDEWEVYVAQLEAYEDQKQFYHDYQSGKVDADRKPIEADHAMKPGGAILAQHGAPAPSTPPPEMPEEVQRPLTRMEHELVKKDAQVRSEINKMVNAHSSVELITSEGRHAFEQAIIDKLNEIIDDHFGTVKAIFLDLIVTT